MVYKPLLENSLFDKLRLYWLGAAIALLGVSGWTVYQQQSSPQPGAASSTASVEPLKSVAAIGRIEPQGSVIKLSVANARDSRIDKILVQAGEQVQADQIIAVLQGLEKQEAALLEAESEIDLQTAMLQQVTAGPSTEGDRLAQLAVIQGLESQLSLESLSLEADLEEAQSGLQLAKTEYERFQKLREEGAISASDLDSRRSEYTTNLAQVKAAQAELVNRQALLRSQLAEAEAQLQRLGEVQPEAIQVSKAQLVRARRKLDGMKAALGDYYVRSPIDGQILSINTQVGEQVSTEEGVVDLAKTDQMYVVAEVYETDVPQVKAGQKVTIVSENGGFLGKLTGTVEQVGLQIKKTDILNTDPASDKNARVVEVRIRLDAEASPQVAGLTYMQVRTQIHLES